MNEWMNWIWMNEWMNNMSIIRIYSTIIVKSYTEDCWIGLNEGTLNQNVACDENCMLYDNRDSPLCLDSGELTKHCPKLKLCYGFLRTGTKILQKVFCEQWSRKLDKLYFILNKSVFFTWLTKPKGRVITFGILYMFVCPTVAPKLLNAMNEVSINS